MATYLERFDLVNDVKFRNRMQVALWEVAVGFLTTGTPHQKTWAARALKGVASTEDMMQLAIRVVADPAVGPNGASVTDAELKTIVTAVAPNLVT